MLQLACDCRLRHLHRFIYPDQNLVPSNPVRVKFVIMLFSPSETGCIYVVQVQSCVPSRWFPRHTPSTSAFHGPRHFAPTLMISHMLCCLSAAMSTRLNLLRFSCYCCCCRRRRIVVGGTGRGVTVPGHARWRRGDGALTWRAIARPRRRTPLTLGRFSTPPSYPPTATRICESRTFCSPDICPR